MDIKYNNNIIIGGSGNKSYIDSELSKIKKIINNLKENFIKSLRDNNNLLERNLEENIKKI